LKLRLHNDMAISKILKLLAHLQNLLILQEFPIPFWEQPAQTVTSLDSLNE